MTTRPSLRLSGVVLSLVSSSVIAASCSRTGYLSLSPEAEGGGGSGRTLPSGGTGSSAPPGSGSQGTTRTSATSASAGDAVTTSTNARASSSQTGLIACKPTPDQDFDGDGFTGNDGDCDDCDARINPSAIETLDNGTGKLLVDEDCNGIVDDLASPCDQGIDLEATSPLEAARAIELCKVSSNVNDWGLLAADFVRADGSADQASTQHGIMSHFGVVRPWGGERLFVMSTGRARTPDQPDACGSSGCERRRGNTPPGYPTPIEGCPRSDVLGDDVGLQVHLRAPSNARGYRFLFKYHSFEYPEWVCTPYNDEFFVKAIPVPEGGLSNGNIAFDAILTPVSANMSSVDVCYPSLQSYFAQQCVDDCPDPPMPYCPLGIAQLNNTGFGTWGNAGATRWMQTEAPIGPGEEVLLRFAIFDTGDGRLDSTILVDDFQWVTDREIGKVNTAPLP